MPIVRHGYSDRKHLSAWRRGYNHIHRQTRQRLLTQLQPGTPCPICRQPMNHGDQLELHHSTPLAVDPSSRGDQIVHKTCNRKQGARA